MVGSHSLGRSKNVLKGGGGELIRKEIRKGLKGGEINFYNATAKPEVNSNSRKNQIIPEGGKGEKLRCHKGSLMQV